jgi:hypothetical protein
MMFVARHAPALEVVPRPPNTPPPLTGIMDPEIIVPITAHAAFLKAAHYFNIKPVMVGVDAVTPPPSK